MTSTISSDFESSDQVAWIGTAFSVALAAFTPLYGKLADIMGRRGANLTALGFFTLGNLGCGLSPNMICLIVSRAVVSLKALSRNKAEPYVKAGMGAGGVFTTAAIVGNDLTPLRNRALLQGAANIFYGASPFRLGAS
jgi:MFS family permease